MLGLTEKLFWRREVPKRSEWCVSKVESKLRWVGVMYNSMMTTPVMDHEVVGICTIQLIFLSLPLQP